MRATLKSRSFLISEKKIWSKWFSLAVDSLSVLNGKENVFPISSCCFLCLLLCSQTDQIAFLKFIKVNCHPRTIHFISSFIFIKHRCRKFKFSWTQSLDNHQSVVALFHFSIRRQSKLNSSIISSDVFNVPQRQSHTFNQIILFVLGQLGDPLTEMHMEHFSNSRSLKNQKFFFWKLTIKFKPFLHFL